MSKNNDLIIKLKKSESRARIQIDRNKSLTEQFVCKYNRANKVLNKNLLCAVVRNKNTKINLSDRKYLKQNLWLITETVRKAKIDSDKTIELLREIMAKI